MAEQTLPPQRPDPPYYSPLTPAPKRRRKAWLIVAAVVAVLVLMAVTATVAVSLTRADAPAPVASAKPSPDELAATKCRTAVVDRLKSPATAQFSDVNTSRSGRMVNVTGSVDSQNGFGAMVRSDFRCEIFVDEDGPVAGPMEPTLIQRK